MPIFIILFPNFALMSDCNRPRIFLPTNTYIHDSLPESVITEYSQFNLRSQTMIISCRNTIARIQIHPIHKAEVGF